MQNILRGIAAMLIAVLTMVGLSVPAQASGPVSSGINLRFTDSRGIASRYHLYADGIDWNRDVGVLYYFDGDYYSQDPQYSQIMQPRGAMLTSVAKDANSKNLVLVAVRTPSARTARNGWTWWENGTSNARWVNEFATAMQATAGFNPNHTWLAGYSGGAELISFDLLTKNRTGWLAGGGAIMIAGGGSDEKTRPSTAHRSLPMYWYAGSRDVAGQTNPPTWSALTAARDGSKTYQKAGYRNAKLSVLQGVGHHGYDLAGLINQTTKAVPASNVYETTRANVALKTSRALGAKTAVSLRAKGTNVVVVQRQTSWARVRYNGRLYWVAWVRLQPATASSAGGSTAPATNHNVYETTRANVALKHSRALGAPTVVSLPARGTGVTLIERNGSWARVEYRGTRYWVAWARIQPATASSGASNGSTGSSGSTATKPPAQPSSSTAANNITYLTTRANVDLKNSRAKGAKTAVRLRAKSTPVTLVQRNGSWARVTYNGSTYWVAWARLVSAGKAQLAPTNLYQTTRNRVELKTSRAKGAPASVTLAKAGTQVTLVERNGSWARVTYNGRTYWVAWVRLQRAQPAAAPRAFAAPVESPSPTTTPEVTPTPHGIPTPEATPSPTEAPVVQEPAASPAVPESTEPTPVEQDLTAEPIDGGETIEELFVTSESETALSTSRGKHAAPAAVLDAGVEVLVLERHDEWAFVEYETKTYWMRWDQLEAQPEMASAQP